MFRVQCYGRTAVVMRALTGESGFYDMVVVVDNNTYPKYRVTAFEVADEIMVMVGHPADLTTAQLERKIVEHFNNRENQ